MEAKLAEFRRQKHQQFQANKARNNPLSPKFVQNDENRESAFVGFIHSICRLLVTFQVSGFTSIRQ